MFLFLEKKLMNIQTSFFPNFFSKKVYSFIFFIAIAIIFSACSSGSSGGGSGSGGNAAQSQGSIIINPSADSIAEGEEFIVELSLRNENATITFDWAVIFDGYLDEADFAENANSRGRATLSASNSTLSLRLETIDDSLYEDDEEFQIQISISDDEVIEEGLTIKSDDPKPEFVINPIADASEGDIIEVIVELTSDSGINISGVDTSFNWELLGEGIDEDFTHTSGSEVILAGRKSSSHLFRSKN